MRFGAAIVFLALELIASGLSLYEDIMERYLVESFSAFLRLLKEYTHMTREALEPLSFIFKTYRGCEN